jgi:ABC-2 type transport system ATP-binding protein
MLIPSHISVKEMFNFYEYFYPNYSREIERKLLELFEIDKSKKFGALSTGQKIKGMLCAAFSSQTDLYLFDEVTAVLDPKSRRNFFKFLKWFKEKHCCSILLATNIAEDLTNSVEKVIFIDDDHKVKIKPIDQLDRLFEEGDSVA